MAERVGISGAGGVNLISDPLAIDDQELVYAKNIIPIRPGVLGIRPGIQYVGSVGSRPLAAAFSDNDKIGAVYVQTGKITYDNGTPQNTPSGLVEWASDGSLSLTVIPERSVTAAANWIVQMLHNPWNELPGSTPVAFIFQPAILPFNGSVYVFPGYPFTGASGKVVSYTGGPNAGNSTSRTTVKYGVQITDFFFNGSNNGVTPRGACQYRSRAAYWDCGPDYQNYIFFSDNFAPATIVQNAGDNVLTTRAFQVGRRGERIVGCVEIMLTAIGSPAQSALLILTNEGAYLMTGEPAQTTDTGSVFGSAVFSKVAYNCGCISPYSIVTTSYGTFWVGQDDVWMFQVGQKPLRVGTKIRPAIERSNTAEAWHIQAAYFDGFLRITLAGTDQFLGEVTPNSDQWWLDLRAGAPQASEENAVEAHQAARWYGPINYMGGGMGPQGVSSGGETFVPGTFMFVQDKRPGTPANLYSIESYNTDPTSGGSGFALASCAPTTMPSSRDYLWDKGNESITLNENNVDTNIDTNTIIDLRTKEYAFEDVILDKVCIGAELSISTTQSARIYVDFIVDGATVYTSYVDAYQQGFILGQSALDSTALINRALQSFSAWCGSGTRYIGKLLQLHVYTQPEIFVGTDSNEFAFVYGAGVQLVATLTTGPVTDALTLASNLAAAMNAAAGAGGEFSASINNSLFQISSHILTWRPAFQSGAGTAAQQAKTRKLGALLGFDTATNPAAAFAQNAITYVPMKRTPVVEFGGLTLAAEIIPRRPGA